MAYWRDDVWPQDVINDDSPDARDSIALESCRVLEEEDHAHKNLRDQNMFNQKKKMNIEKAYKEVDSFENPADQTEMQIDISRDEGEVRISSLGGQQRLQPNRLALDYIQQNKRRVG